MRTVLCVAAALLVGQGVIGADDVVSREALTAAAQKSLDLLVKTSPAFIKKGGCNSCHNQTLPAAAQTFARSRGIPVGDPIEQLPPEVSDATIERYAEYSVAGGGGVNALSFQLFEDDLAKRPADGRVRAQIQYIKGQQQPEGYWRGGGMLTNNGQAGLSRPGAARPPLMFDDFTPTAFMVRALKAYGAPSDVVDTTARIAKARQWLLGTKATRLQEHAFKVLGLKWSGARSPGDRRRRSRSAGASAARWRLLAAPDAGSDAYATGLALFALHEAGMRSTHPVYQAGLKFLLTTQAADGTWHVRTRSLEFQPYFESGYPYRARSVDLGGGDGLRDAGDRRSSRAAAAAGQ